MERTATEIWATRRGEGKGGGRLRSRLACVCVSARFVAGKEGIDCLVSGVINEEGGERNELLACWSAERGTAVVIGKGVNSILRRGKMS